MTGTANTSSSARIPVRPRVFRAGGDEPLCLERVLHAALARDDVTAVAIIGDRGSGKTTALHYIDGLALGDNWKRLDMPSAAAVTGALATGDCAVYTAANPYPHPRQLILQLAPWGDDEVLEYLMNRHPARCHAVMQRWRAAADRVTLGGIPELCAAVLDELASNEATLDLRSALLDIGRRACATPAIRRAAGEFSVAAECGALRDSRLLEDNPDLTGDDAPPLLRYRPCRLVMAAEHITATLVAGGSGAPPQLPLTLSTPLALACGRAAADCGEARRILLELLSDPDERESHPTAAGIMAASGTGWTPDPQAPPPLLSGAYLERVCWPGVSLPGVVAPRADLRCANLSGAVLERAQLQGANLSGAQLDDANLTRGSLAYANFSTASLQRATLHSAYAASADFSGACLEGATCYGTDVSQADFTRAKCAQADFSNAKVCRVNVEGCDFAAARFDGARLSETRLRLATLTAASFAGAELSRVDLEYVELPEADFARARLIDLDLTGSRMPRARFGDAVLRNVGLADIEWPHADLRGATLANVSFHAGSSRSGLVGSPLACEGSRTGFYTDEYDEQTFRSPEEIRKADLRGADLRGAKFDGVDFYLVDLRGARLDAHQLPLLRRSGAILESRM